MDLLRLGGGAESPLKSPPVLRECYKTRHSQLRVAVAVLRFINEAFFMYHSSLTV